MPPRERSTNASMSAPAITPSINEPREHPSVPCAIILFPEM